MSFKEALKMKLPFTRKGLEDYLNEELDLIRCQQTDDIRCIAAEHGNTLAAQLDSLAADLDTAIALRVKDLMTQFAKELNLQLDRRTNDLQRAVIEQLTQEFNTRLQQEVDGLDNAITRQTETLAAHFAIELNVQLDRRINDLQRAVEMQNEVQSGLLFTRLREEINLQLHQRTNDLQKNVVKSIREMHGDLYGFFGRFPKMLSFEVSLADHCNLNCAGCNHFSPLALPSFADLEEFTRDFKRMAYLFGDCTLQVKLLGGEPLLNRDINKYLPVARECFPQAEILIVTNGLLLPQMDELFWETCRENRVTIAPTKYPVNFDYDAAEELAKAHRVNYQYFSDRETTRVFEKYALDSRGIQDRERNYRMCSIPNPCPYLRKGRLYLCPIAPTAHYMSEAFGTQFEESPHDFIDIYQAKSAEEILEFLAKPIPFCRYCRRDVNEVIPWGQSKRELSEWTI